MEGLSQFNVTTDPSSPATMPEKEERTFYLYRDGYLPQELALGHLVFGTYVRPTKGRQCPMEPLR